MFKIFPQEKQNKRNECTFQILLIGGSKKLNEWKEFSLEDFTVNLC